MFKIGDIVTRKKYGNDILFKIDKIEGKKVFLKGLDIRLYADTLIDDLSLHGIPKKKEEIKELRNLETDTFFYIPGSVLHIDADEEYLKKCEEYYKNQKIKIYGYTFKEEDMKNHIEKLIKKHNPNILVITGHDAYFKKKKNNENYKNSKHYINAVKEARNIIKEHEKLVIIAGACQSDYENLIKSGSTFASSPKHINIHALDPAIIASYIAKTSNQETINIEEVLEKTHYGKEGIGGIITKGAMLVGYPRKGE
ncbi:MAG: peptidase [Bacilli bacterium]|nr:peptidase [Bacilli bacterium]